MPEGYDPIDLPMMGVKIRVNGVWQERHFYNFLDVQERFVNQLAEFFVEKTEFLFPNGNSNSGSFVSVDDEWMRRACKKEEIPEWTRDEAKMNRYMRETHERHKEELRKQREAGRKRLHHQREQ